MPNALFSSSDAPIIALVLREAINAALDALADQHENKPDEWLDQIELETVKRVKNLISERIPTHVEAAMIEIGIVSVRAVFTLHRKRLAEA